MMAMIDVIKFDGLNNRDWLVYKCPKDDFVMGTQLIVKEGQIAVFVKNGKACDYFTAGKYTLDSANLPILQGFVNIPFGGSTPFTAEVFFINKTSKLDLFWGTDNPISIVDPKYHTKLRVRAFGQYGIKLSDYRVFLTGLIGSLGQSQVVRYNTIIDYFRGMIVTKVKTKIAQYIIEKQISVLEISAYLEDLSERSKADITEEFDRFGLSIVNFYISSVNFPDEDFDKINEILENKAEFDIMGDRRYGTKRSFDVMDKVASSDNGGSMANATLGLGLGAGAGMSVGSTYGNMINQTMNQNIPTNEEKTVKCKKCNHSNSLDTNFCANCGNKLKVETIQCPSCNTEIDQDTKFCHNCGGNVQELLKEKENEGRKECPHCKYVNIGITKFCSNCGERLEEEEKKCSACSKVVEAGMKFCPNCGNGIG